MARFRKPYFKKSHNAWYINLDGKNVRLARDKGEAHERYHELMKDRNKAARHVSPGVPAPASLGEVLDQFLASAFKGKADATKGWYANKLDPFVEHLGRQFTAAELKPFHVDQWITSHTNWSAGTARNLWRAVQRLCRWSHSRGLIPELAVLHQEKPKAGRREVVISPEQYAELLSFVRNDKFRAIVVVAWECGARPQELTAARVRHLDTEHKRLVFPPQENQDKDHPRIIYLTDVAFDLLRPKGGARAEDHLLVNSEGRPWTSDACQCAFAALYMRMTKAKVATRKYCLYHFRHSWLDRMLKAKVDVLTCAILMGHRDPSMIAKTYQHLSQSPHYLREALMRAAG